MLHHIPRKFNEDLLYCTSSQGKLNLIFCFVSMIKWGRSWQIMLVFSLLCLPLSRTSVWCCSQFILHDTGNRCCHPFWLLFHGFKQRSIWRAPHYLKVKPSNYLLNDRIGWQTHFCTYWKPYPKNVWYSQYNWNEQSKSVMKSCISCLAQ